MNKPFSESIFRVNLFAVAALAGAALCSCSSGTASARQNVLEAGTTAAINDDWQQNFDPTSCNLVSTGRNNYFVLEPGHKLILEDDETRVEIKVLDEIKTVAGVETRVVEEREWINGELYEVAMNYFAICEDTKDVYYFGEAVDFYNNGKVVNHEGAWIAGEGGNKAGLYMPGEVALNMKYYQEIAPGEAMDRAEILSLDDVCETPAGTFKNCLKVREGTPLDNSVLEYKYYAPGLGLIIDDDKFLTGYGS